MIGAGEGLPTNHKFSSSAINTIQIVVLAFVQTLSIWLDFKFAKIGAGEGVPKMFKIKNLSKLASVDHLSQNLGCKHYFFYWLRKKPAKWPTAKSMFATF